MDYYVRPRHHYSHSRTCTRSVLCRRPYRLVASLICHLLDRANVHEISALVTWFQSMSDISSHYGDLDLLYIFSHYGDHGPLYIFIMEILIYVYCTCNDHLCDILYHAYSWPLYSYVSRTTICTCSYMQSCIIVLCWLGGWSSSGLFITPFLGWNYNVFQPLYDPSKLTH